MYDAESSLACSLGVLVAERGQMKIMNQGYDFHPSLGESHHLSLSYSLSMV